MIRLVLYFLGILAAAAAFHWLADRPGTLTVEWQGMVLETSVFRAVVLLGLLMTAMLLGVSILRRVWRTPALIGRFVTQRRERRGLDAISSGMIAIGSGDRTLATRAAIQARKSLPNEPLTHILRAQAAQLQGDTATARRIFEAMLATPDTEQLGLRGLFLEAEREGETVAAMQFAERAMKLNPKLEWPAGKLFDLQCRNRDWDGALATLSVARQNGLVDRKIGDRRRAVLLTAKAQQLEDEHGEKALAYATEAHGLAPDLVPAAAIAGRLLASRGQTPKAAKIIQRTWKSSPHPDLAAAYAFARPGDSVSDRLERARQLAKLAPGHAEGAIAVATTAIDARDWAAAEEALQPLIESRLTQRVCTLMARIAGEGHGNTGRVREWLARAVNAPRDPAWTADGIVSETWAPISPVSGTLDAFEWRVPVEEMEKPEAAIVSQRIEALVPLGVAEETRLARNRPLREVQAADAEPADIAPAASMEPAADTTAVPPRRPEPPAPIPLRPIPPARGQANGAAARTDEAVTAEVVPVPPGGAAVR